MPDTLTKCTVCGGLIDAEDLFCANCGAEAPLHNQTEAPLRDGLAKPQTRETTHNFTCDGCGASMSFDASAQTLRCPFCASEKLQKQLDAKALAPQSVVPFKIERPEAVASMRTWLGRGFWRPDDLSEDALIVSMTPVYVPFWVFEAKTHTYWTADTNDLPMLARGDWRPLSGEHRASHRNLLVGASHALRLSETSAICPFDLGAARPPDEVDLEQVPGVEQIAVEQFRIGRKYARPLARQGLEQLESQACTQYVPGRCRNMHVNVRIEDLTSQPLLLPVWIMAYRYRDTLYRFLVNGQSGRATGQAPTSVWKIAAAVGIALVAGLVGLTLLGALSR